MGFGGEPMEVWKVKISRKRLGSSVTMSLHAPAFNYTSITAIPVPALESMDMGAQRRVWDKGKITQWLCPAVVAISAHSCTALWLGKSHFLNQLHTACAALHENQHMDPGRSSSCLWTAQCTDLWRAFPGSKDCEFTLLAGFCGAEGIRPLPCSKTQENSHTSVQMLSQLNVKKVLH